MDLSKTPKVEYDPETFEIDALNKVMLNCHVMAMLDVKELVTGQLPLKEDSTTYLLGMAATDHIRHLPVSVWLQHDEPEMVAELLSWCCDYFHLDTFIANDYVKE